MTRDRWENIIGGIICFVVLIIWGAILIWFDQWPFGWFWLIIYSIMGGLGYIALMYHTLEDVKKKKEDKKEEEVDEKTKFRRDWYNNVFTDDGPYK